MKFSKSFNETETKLPNSLKRIIATSIATVSSSLSQKWLFRSNYCKVRIKRTPEQNEKERRAALSASVLILRKKKSCKLLNFLFFLFPGKVKVKK